MFSKPLSPLEELKTNKSVTEPEVLPCFELNDKLSKWHEKPLLENRYRTHRDIGFRVQFSMKFPRQVMNFPIESFLMCSFMCLGFLKHR